MNKERRKRISEAVELIGQARDILEEVKDEEQESYDNLPEGMRAASKEDMGERAGISLQIHGRAAGHGRAGRKQHHRQRRGQAAAAGKITQ